MRSIKDSLSKLEKGKWKLENGNSKLEIRKSQSFLLFRNRPITHSLN